MEYILKKHLFEKHFFVWEEEDIAENQAEVIAFLAERFNIALTAGIDKVSLSFVRLAADALGKTDIAEPFYKGFPKSVLALSKKALLLDQFLHYCQTYGLGLIEETGHSLLEEEIYRGLFKEETPVRYFSVISEKEAEEKLIELAKALLKGSRPLSNDQYFFVALVLKNYPFTVEKVGSKNTAARLLLDTRDIRRFGHFIWLSDVVKVLERMLFQYGTGQTLTDMRLRASDRKWLTKLLDYLFENARGNTRECFEKKAVWNGLLHLLHYKPKTVQAECFLRAIRGKENLSVYSEMEGLMREGDTKGAAALLKETKGDGAVLRNLNYLISRAKSMEDINFIMSLPAYQNGALLLQLFLRYNREEEEYRRFVFHKNNLLRVHTETEKEASHRTTRLSDTQIAFLSAFFLVKLEEFYKDRLGKVYIDGAMKKIALPLEESTSNGGYGVLPKGSRIPFPADKKIRAFTYWERVNDIDLSVLGICKDGTQVEFSWRNMWDNQTFFITFSGDETSGYHGGSEYFDVDIEGFRKKNPHIAYMVFCNNVYSGTPFSECVCRAGYMARDKEDSGKVFEPKTVESSFVIDCHSTSAYLFGLDLEKAELVWLNLSREGETRVAAEQSAHFLSRYFDVTEKMNMHRFFSILAKEVVSSPEEAEVLVSDKVKEEDYPDKKIVRSYDFEYLSSLW
ncbi:MAG: hypothetical protein J6K61_02740 [Clostridia bacterium]|nr:hypothetical protein [Clostridia bacterium]